MNWQYTPYLIPLLITTVALVTLAIYVWQHYRPNAASFVLLTLAIAAWTFGYMLEISSLDLATKIFWGKVQYLGIVSIPVAWLTFILQFTHQDRWLTRPNLILLVVIPLITLIFVWTTETHGLIWQQQPTLNTSGPFVALKVSHGSWFWVNWLFANGLLLISSLLLINTLRGSPQLYRWQTGTLLFMALAPWVGNTIYVFDQSPIPNLDLTPIVFAVSTLAIGWNLFHFRLLDIVPIAHQAIFESMSDGIIVLDVKNRVVDLNRAAQAIVGFNPAEAKGKTNTQVMSNWPILARQLRNEVETPVEVKLTKDGESYYYDTRFSPLADHNGHLTGRLVVLRDISKRKQAEAALQKSEEQFRLVFELAPIGMVILTPTGRFWRINQAFCNLVGYSAEELVGRSFVDLTHPDDLAPTLALTRQLLRGEIPHFQLEERYLSKERQIIHVVLQVTLIRDTNNHPYHLIGQIVDVTNHKQIETALAEARDQALEANRLKTELLAKISHELRTPLAAILGFAEMIEAEVYGPITSEQQQPIIEIIDSAQYLIKLVNELLSQAQLDAGKLGLEISPFEATTLVEKVRAKMCPLAQARGLTLITEIAPDMPATLCGDPVRIQQILVNLISNAIKFTPTGRVQIRLYRPAPNQWAIQVSDTGIGIPVEAQTYIFEPFRQVDGSTTREHPGTGLGLAIVKQLATLMGGEITLESEIGRGSTFTVLLPLEVTKEKTL